MQIKSDLIKNIVCDFSLQHEFFFLFRYFNDNSTSLPRQTQCSVMWERIREVFLWHKRTSFRSINTVLAMHEHKMLWQAIGRSFICFLPRWKEMIVWLSSSIMWTRRPFIPITVFSCKLFNNRTANIIGKSLKSLIQPIGFTLHKNQIIASVSHTNSYWSQRDITKNTVNNLQSNVTTGCILIRVRIYLFNSTKILYNDNKSNQITFARVAVANDDLVFAIIFPRYARRLRELSAILNHFPRPQDRCRGWWSQ